jgi:hypothetical protein
VGGQSLRVQSESEIPSGGEQEVCALYLIFTPTAKVAHSLSLKVSSGKTPWIISSASSGTILSWGGVPSKTNKQKNHFQNNSDTVSHSGPGGWWGKLIMETPVPFARSHA